MDKFDKMDKKAVAIIAIVFALVFSMIALIIKSMFEKVKADEWFVTYEELRKFDHDLQTKEGWIFDLWEDSKRQDQRIQNNREYTNSIDARLFEVEKKLENKQSHIPPQEKETVVAVNEFWKLTVTNHHSVNPMIRRGKEEQDKELRLLVNDAIAVYLSETGRNPSCSVWWVSVSLGDIIHAKIIQEWGYEIWGAGRRTNNPWSLRNAWALRQVVSFHNIDSTHKWREYATIQDWLVDLIYVVDQKYNCAISINWLFAYVYWPRAERTKARLDHVNAIYNNFYARLTK